MEKRTHVLYFSPNAYIGGAERFVLNICEAHLLHGRYRPSIVFFNDGEAVACAKNLGIETFLLPVTLRLSRPISVLKSILFLRKLIKNVKPSIVHSTMPYSHLLAVPSTFHLRCKKVWFQHGPVGGLLDHLASLLPCDLNFFNSNFLMKKHNKSLVFRAKKPQQVISFGIKDQSAEPRDVRRIRERFLPDGQGLLCLSAGRMSPLRGFETLIKAAASLKHDRPDIFHNTRFLIIGSPESKNCKKYYNSLKSLINGFQLSKNVILVERQSDLTPWFLAANIFIHAPTAPEPFGLAVAEAMLQGTLIIGPNAGGITTFLKDNETGLTFNTSASDSAKQLSSLITKIADNKFPTQELRIKGKNFIQKNHTIKNMLMEVEHAYDSLLESCP